MRTLVLALVSVLALAAPLAAQPSTTQPIAPSHLAAAREYLDLMRMDEVAMAGVEISFDQQIQANPMLRPYRATMTEWARELFSSEEARNAFATAYAEVLTEADIRALIEFMRSPAGQRLAAKQAELARRGAEVGRTLAESRQADLMERLQRVEPTQSQR